MKFFANMMLEYSIVDSNNSTVYSGNQSWSGTNSSGLNYTWNVSGLSAGYYTFHADLYINGTFVDTDYDSFMVYANTSGGGGGGSGNLHLTMWERCKLLLCVRLRSLHAH